MSDSAQGPFLDRRRVLGCAALFGIAGPLLVACGSDSSDKPSSGSGDTDGGSEAPAAGGALIAASEVPVGGGVVLTDQQVIVVQPTEGEFKAYSSVCTHQGNPVTTVEDGVMMCPSHGSQFSVEDGAVEKGPATAPLPEVGVKVEGGQVVRA